MRSFHIDPEVMEKIVDQAAWREDGTDLQRDTIRAIRRAIKYAGENGRVIISSQKYKRERRRWEPEEEKKFIEGLKTVMKGTVWEQGRKKEVWEAMSGDMKRAPSSLKSKYAQLRRRGIL